MHFLGFLWWKWDFQWVTAYPNKKILSYSEAGSKCLRRMPPKSDGTERFGFGRQEINSTVCDFRKGNAEAGPGAREPAEREDAWR